MTRFQQFVTAFWVLVIGMLLWSFYSYNQGMNQAEVDHPTQTHFYFLNTNAPPVAAAAQADKADVEQTGFVVQPDTPSAGQFTCLVTLKNAGVETATNVQICVRPYRGVSSYNEDVGHQINTEPLDDSSPVSQFNDWLSFPDLAPGEAQTRPVSFTDRTDIKPGINPTPLIAFETDKKASKKPAPPDPNMPSVPKEITPITTPAHHHPDE